MRGDKRQDDRDDSWMTYDMTAEGAPGAGRDAGWVTKSPLIILKGNVLFVSFLDLFLKVRYQRSLYKRFALRPAPSPSLSLSLFFHQHC
jgi:hypothetical protein